ncbi:hypothetical protein AAEO56_07115 [Flavobacterium sp. DGU11]|uniref:Uncharacterized protein n=1 Tax=Flavobacterium arundinis TaxID=3139143 RepID=A0ABU9HV44_9FLAO
MKNAIMIIMLLTAGLVKAQSKFDSWPELKAFHQVMSQTFHPSEEGNLEPVKKRSGELHQKAADLKKAKIPAEFRSDKIEEAINTLEKDSKALHKLIASGGNDQEITKKLSLLHDTFHEIVGLCNKEEHR